MKPVDIDKLFEKYLRNIMAKNVGKYTEDQWEAKMPELYEKFGDSPILELDGLSPRAYFTSLSGADAVSALQSYVLGGISVPDYLCDAILEKKESESALLALVTPQTNGELLAYAVNLLDEMGSVAPMQAYMDALFDPAYATDTKELMTEMLALHPELTAKDATARYAGATEEQKAYLLDIIVAGEQNDEAFAILMDAFRRHPDNRPLYVQYLVKYGDERALPDLYQAINDPDVDYLSFQELRNAIESLGGEYEKDRDFTDDRFYKAILRAQEREEDPS